MDSLVNLIQSSSGSPAELKSLLVTLQQREDQLLQALPELDTAAEALNPAHHTLGLVFILNCKAAAVPVSQPQAAHVFVGQCRRMLLGCDPQQVQMVPAQCKDSPHRTLLSAQIPDDFPVVPAPQSLPSAPSSLRPRSPSKHL